jgi:putative transposase
MPTCGIICSMMSRRGNCYDNAVMESFSTVKSVLGERFDSNGSAKIALFDCVEVLHNQRRRHSSAGRMGPATFERKMTQAA